MSDPGPAPVQPIYGESNPSREYLVTFIVGSLVVGFIFFYQYYWSKVVWPKTYYEEYVAVTTGALLHFTLLSILLFMRSSPATFGMTAGNARLGWRYGLGMTVIMLPFIAFIAFTPDAMSYYPLMKKYGHHVPLSFSYFIYFECLQGMYFFAWEWFFRGYLLFGLARGMGSWALIAQAIPFGILHWGKPWPEFAGSFIAGLVLGFVALRTGSFLTGFLVHWLIAILFDLFVMLALSQRGLPLF